MMEGTLLENGDREIAVDIDGDGIIDKIIRSDPGSASILPADPTTLAVTLSSTGKTLALEGLRLQVVKYQSAYYAGTWWVETEHGPWHEDIYRIGPKEITKICSFTGKGIGR